MFPSTVIHRQFPRLEKRNQPFRWNTRFSQCHEVLFLSVCFICTQLYCRVHNPPLNLTLTLYSINIPYSTHKSLQLLISRAAHVQVVFINKTSHIPKQPVFFMFLQRRSTTLYVSQGQVHKHLMRHLFAKALDKCPTNTFIEDILELVHVLQGHADKH